MNIVAPSMMMKHAILAARAEFYHRTDRQIGNDAFLAYVREHQLDVQQVGWYAGVTAVLPIEELSGDRFEFADQGKGAFVCEALSADGETVCDLVAWHLHTPMRPITMFGRCGLLGLWQANAPGTYFMGGRLRLHRSPLCWLQSGCDGAAIVDRHLAGRQLLEVPGQIETEDASHGREIAALLRATANIDNKVIAPVRHRRAA